MEILEIRKGLRRLNFTDKTDEEHGKSITHVVLEFEVSARLAGDQMVLINLGTRDGILRQLQGRPRLLPSRAGTSSASFTYRLEGNVS